MDSNNTKINSTLGWRQLSTLSALGKVPRDFLAWPGGSSKVRPSSRPPSVSNHPLPFLSGLGRGLAGQIDGLGTDGSRHVGVTPGLGVGEGGALVTATIGPWSAPAARKPPGGGEGAPGGSWKTGFPTSHPSISLAAATTVVPLRRREEETPHPPPREGGRPSRDTQHRRVRGLISGCRWRWVGLGSGLT